LGRYALVRRKPSHTLGIVNDVPATIGARTASIRDLVADQECGVRQYSWECDDIDHLANSRGPDLPLGCIVPPDLDNLQAAETDR
jgi:hypothetical protein